MRKILIGLLSGVFTVGLHAQTFKVQTLVGLDTTNSTSTTTGGAVFAGGMGLGADLWAGGNIHTGNVFTTGQYISGAPATFRTLNYQTNGVGRWILGENADTESGSNAGSNFYLQAETDAGSPSTVVMQIQRSSGIVLRGLTAPVTTGDLQYTDYQNAGVGSFVGGNPAFMQYSNDASSALILLYKSRSATKGTSTVVQNNDDIGELDFEPDGGSGPVKSSFINAAVDSATITSTSVPARLMFWTMPVGGAFPLERARFTNAGRLLINTTSDDGTDQVQINGSTLTAGLTSSNGLSVTGGSVSGIPGRLLNVQVFSASGTYTPTSGTSSIIVKVQAPGGGSGGTALTTASQVAIGGGGNGGSYAEVRYVSGVTTQTITIGAVGAAGAAGANAGGTGGTTSFGSLISCPGGNGGGGGTAAGAAGGSGAAPTPNTACTVSGGITFRSVIGGRGQGGFALTSGTGFGGAGGNSALGIGYVTAGSAQTGYGPGAGAGGPVSGNSAGAAAGAAGAAGEIIVYEYQ